jgi:endonuclease YncB( thermonuclease family)
MCFSIRSARRRLVGELAMPRNVSDLVLLRLVGFDTPETGDRARCEHEGALGVRATSRLRELIKTRTAELKCELIKTRTAELKLIPCACPPGTEGTPSCNFGRACGILTTDGRDVGHILIAEGLAKPFRCSGFSCPSRAPWC